MKYFSLAAAALAAAILATGAQAHVAQQTSGSYIDAKTHFYSDYEHLTVDYLLGASPYCVQDEYGGYANDNCYDIDWNDGEWDVRVWQTYPRWKFVYSERNEGISGHDSTDLFWDIDLGAPECYSGHWTRSYRAVVRLFSPLTGNAIASDTVRFGVVCN